MWLQGNKFYAKRDCASFVLFRNIEQKCINHPNKCRKSKGELHISTCTFEKREDSAKTESQNDIEETITNFSNNKNTIFYKLRRLLFQI